MTYTWRAALNNFGRVAGALPTRTVRYAALSLLLAGPALADTAGGYTFTGNVIAKGLNACSAITGTFPATLTYFVSSQTGLITTAYLNILIQNPKTSLTLQTIHDVLVITGTGAGTYTTLDPQLFGLSTAFTPLFGTFSGGVSFPQNGYFEIGSNYGQPTMTPLTLSSGSCQIQLNAVLYANPE